jgi:hypothetical protein
MAVHGVAAFPAFEKEMVRKRESIAHYRQYAMSMAFNFRMYYIAR